MENDGPFAVFFVGDKSANLGNVNFQKKRRKTCKIASGVVLEKLFSKNLLKNLKFLM